MVPAEVDVGVVEGLRDHVVLRGFGDGVARKDRLEIAGRQAPADALATQPELGEGETRLFAPRLQAGAWL